MTAKRVAAATSLLLACLGTAWARRPPRLLPLPPLERVVSIHDTRDGRRVTLDQLVARAAGAEVVFVGETHLDETTHRFQEELYRWLLTARENRVVLSLEMFERDVQQALDDYVQGRSTEEQFLEAARPWANYLTDYRPLIEIARAKRLPVVAANAPRPVLRKMGFGGKEAFGSLGEEDARWLPRELHPNSPQYWERFARAVRGHFGDLMRGDPDAQLYSTQSLWDNSMGEAVADALERHPGHLVLHVAGGFHVAHRQGTVEQVLARRPDTRVVTVDVRPTGDLALGDGDGLSDVADYVVFAEARARSLSEGTHGVTVGSELKYRLHVPEWASASRPSPLLVWLPAEGLGSDEGLRQWELALEEEAALVAVEPPFPQTWDDLHVGGRWYFEGDFDEHVGSVVQGLERIVSRVVRTQPVDERRIVLAGEGTGGTVVAWAARYSGRLPVQAFAVAPREHGKLRQAALPEPVEAEEPRYPFDYQDLTVLASQSATGWWEKEAEAYQASGQRAAVLPLDATAPAVQVESALRRALGVAALPSTRGLETLPHVVLVLREDTQTARFWATLEARRLLADGEVASVTTSSGLSRHLSSLSGHPGVRVQPLTLEGEPELPLRRRGVRRSDIGAPRSLDAAREGELLPLAPGPFGGTTVVVTLPGVPEAQRRAWDEIGASGVLKERNRFCQLKVAHSEGAGPTLGEVLAGIRDSGRSNVLIVPACFAASADEMRALLRLTEGQRHGLTLQWLPGLGGRWSLR